MFSITIGEFCVLISLIGFVVGLILLAIDGVKGEKKESFAEASTIVRNGILNDPELYMAFQANIAMSFSDYYYRAKKKKKKLNIHEVSNDAAKSFLNMWCKPTEAEQIKGAIERI